VAGTTTVSRSAAYWGVNVVAGTKFELSSVDAHFASGHGMTTPLPLLSPRQASPRVTICEDSSHGSLACVPAVRSSRSKTMCSKQQKPRLGDGERLAPLPDIPPFLAAIHTSNEGQHEFVLTDEDFASCLNLKLKTYSFRCAADQTLVDDKPISDIDYLLGKLADPTLDHARLNFAPFPVIGDKFKLGACHYIDTPAGCRSGNRCRFSHLMQASADMLRCELSRHLANGVTVNRASGEEAECDSDIAPHSNIQPPNETLSEQPSAQLTFYTLCDALAARSSTSGSQDSQVVM
jgi:hypothetical protein